MLHARGLAKTYAAPGGGRVTVLAGVDLTVRPGELALVVGPSGAGKSTLLNLLGLLDDADAGEVWYRDVCVSRLGRRGRSLARGRTVGFVFQTFLLLPGLTVLDNVLLAARYVGTNCHAARGRAVALLEEFGLGARRDHLPAQLSGGEQQRAALCRALLNDPAVVLADEPTGNLDDASGRAVLDALRGRARAGAAVVVVSHRAEALDLATTVHHLVDRRLVCRDGARPGDRLAPARADAQA